MGDAMIRRALCVLLFCGANAALGQPQLTPGMRGPSSAMATRSVSAYLALERGLADALRAGNRGAAAAMLTEDFVARSARDSDGQSGADWLKGELASPLDKALVRDLSVSEFNEVAVVSFLLDTQRVHRKRRVAATLYVVDVWRQNRLAARFVSVPRNAPPAPSRPSGRE